LNAAQLPLIGEILSRLDAVEIEPSTMSCDPSQHVVGEMPEGLQRLASLRYRLYCEYEAAVNEANAHLETINSHAKRRQEKKRLEGEVSILKDKALVVSDLFRLSLRLAFPDLIGKEVIGYANGFQVYWQEQGDQGEGQCDCPICSAMCENGTVEIFVAIPTAAAQEARGLGLLGLLGCLTAKLRGQIPDESPTPEGEEQPATSGEQRPEGEQTAE